MILHSETVTQKETFRYSLRIGTDWKILSAQKTWWACAECENCSSDPDWFCPDHPDTAALTVLDSPDLVDTPINLGKNRDTDVVFFLPESSVLKCSFGLQTRQPGYMYIANLNGEYINDEGIRCVVTPNVPEEIAEHARKACS